MATERRYEQIRADARHPFPGRPPRTPVPRRDRAQRFVELMCLLADGRQWPAKQLSQQLKVTVRTIHRDMKLLEARSLATRTLGRSGSYQLVAEKSWERPQLSVRELISLLIVAAGAESQTASQGGLALKTVTKLIGFQGESVREALLGFAGMLRSQSPEATQWLSRQSWLAVILEGLVETRPLKIWLSEGRAEAPAPPLTIIPSNLSAGEGRWQLKSHRVSPTGGDLTVDVANITAAEFDVDAR